MDIELTEEQITVINKARFRVKMCAKALQRAQESLEEALDVIPRPELDLQLPGITSVGDTLYIADVKSEVLYAHGLDDN